MGRNNDMKFLNSFFIFLLTASPHDWKTETCFLETIAKYDCRFPVWNGSLDSLVINLLLFSVSVLVFSSHLSLEFSFENEVYTAHSGLYTTARTFSFNIAYRMRINNISFNCKQHVQVFIQMANKIDLSFNSLLTISSKHLNLFTGMQCRRNQACGRYLCQ